MAPPHSFGVAIRASTAQMRARVAEGLARPKAWLGRRWLGSAVSAPTQPPLAALLGGLNRPRGEQLYGTIGPTWMQGQTTFGGCSAALCLLGARSLLEASAESRLPLRSAQITFLGAAGGSCHVSSTILRKGKSSAFVRSELAADGGLATSAMLAFGKARRSTIDVSLVSTPTVLDLPPPTLSLPLSEALGVPLPVFMQNFELRMARRGTSTRGALSGTSTWLWVRHAGALDDGGVEGVDAEVALLALADTPPPALIMLLPLQQAFPNVSSLTWHVDVCDDVEARASSQDGWWLIEGRTETARDGYSAAAMTLWGGPGDWERGPLLIGRQTIAVYL